MNFRHLPNALPFTHRRNPMQFWPIRPLSLVLGFAALSPAEAGWEIGVARAESTPAEPVPMAGYGGKTRMSEAVEHPVWLKAVAFRDTSGVPSGLVQRPFERG
jgi:hypothetical protein